MKHFTPRKYQREAADHAIATPRCAMWMPVGAGKCAATFMALEELSLLEDVYPVLIIAPKRVARDTWPGEINKWVEFNHLTLSSLVGTEKERNLALTKKAKIYTINFECIGWLVKKLGNNWPFKTIVFDEASRLRGFRLRQGTKRSQILASRAHLTKRFIELTGTPQPNGLINLWRNDQRH